MDGNTKRKQLLEWFPKARQSLTSLSITSPIDFGYNCVAWALDKTDRWWQPGNSRTFWPHPESETTLAAYLRMFESQGFQRCETQVREAGLVKIALYVDQQDNFLHVARQLDSGRWSSKCGAQSDISHSTPELLDGPTYGRFWGCLKRAT